MRFEEPRTRRAQGSEKSCSCSSTPRISRDPGPTALWVLPGGRDKHTLVEYRGFNVAAWAVICTNCNTKIAHSQIPKRGLSELFLPSKPEVPLGATITCPKCQSVVSYARTDLRYVTSD